ncbi:hypothetical protein F5888DRAFT_1702504 [Russula emetica]|nr:hypothetical protein F5888DRAFT_1702504 [Russula emetica]
MAPKGGNAKKESGRAKKAENELIKRAAAVEAKERGEVDKWGEGAKTNKAKEDKEEKRKAELARKAENARLLAEEEETSSKKASPKTKAGSKKAASSQSKPAGPGAIAAGGAPAVAPEESTQSSSKNGGEAEEIESFSATGIDNALDLIDVVTAKMDKASLGNQAAVTVEKHPERRFKVLPFSFSLVLLFIPRLKAAFNAYMDRELPNIRSEQPGLRLQQYKVLRIILRSVRLPELISVCQ